MGLVDYSDSETSDVEQPAPTKAPPPSRARPAFSKVVDRSNPGKIKVSLPLAASKEDGRGDEPPTKRAKISGAGTFGGFNSFLPAPKRPSQTTSTTAGGNQSNRAEPGAKFSFKTGAAPAFDRGGASDEGYGESQAQNASTNKEESQIKEPVEEVKLVGKPLMFKPLSVSRKPAKKKPASAARVQTTVPDPITPLPTQKPIPRPKVSLFSMSAESESFSSAATSSTQEYRPMMYAGGDETDNDRNEESQDYQASYEDFTPTASQNPPPPAVPTPPASQSLNDIAGDLNLSAAERRQLFGRQKAGRGGQSALNVINFNTDKEYLHNEELRAAGEQVALNPVRAIAPGKHSLKQLVNAAVQQKDALEESFAKGKSNRQEASSRYGW